MVNSVLDLLTRGMPADTARDMIRTASGHLNGIYDACGPSVEANVRVAFLNRRLYRLCTDDRVFVTFVPLVHWQTAEVIPRFPGSILELLCMTDADLVRALECLGERPREENWNRAQKLRRLGRRWIAGFDYLI
ncbi:hypothetical protein JDV02_000717 [Purpureocillium takamizusanense]|uniref:Uncharacterized protein n=1 Tax=Purpureocillium takamizusanense TaxID=2060973 RepID=A0A9Q8Q771_9HYPO|nr:uncharacterized protein JDV02_000717 [Purpureocillium takamizusanense]UNI14037.1 hypothetical protein JDV02_000717 [Purpureocillium takamizusanense]